MALESHWIEWKMSAESATRRAGDEPARGAWHTLVPGTLTSEYRPVRPLVGTGGLGSRATVTQSNEIHTHSNIFQFVMT